MDRTVDAEKQSSISDERYAEIGYHKKLNRRFVFFALPSFALFSIFWFCRSNIVQGIIFSILSINAVLSYLAGRRIKNLDHLVLLKQVGTAIAFCLLAASMIIGLLSDDIYISFPWIFLYPMAVLLMFGERIGIVYALMFCILTAIVIYMIDLPAWNDHLTGMFKLNSFFALMSVLAIALIAERTRVRMRNSLINARNKHIAAEERQRRTNEELKGEIEMRAQSERALSESEARYRALFEESTVSIVELNFRKVKAYLDSLPRKTAADLENYLLRKPEELNRCIDSIAVTAVNRAALKLYGVPDIESLKSVLPPDLPVNMARRLSALYHSSASGTQLDVQTRDGRKLHLLVSSTIPAGYERSWEKVFTSIYDISERVAMEEERKRVDQQLHHTRQIQAIASLAGGIAHQFNNSLAVISGNLDLLELNSHEDGNNMRHIDALRSSSDRITRLTEQLLAYAQGGKYQPRDFPVKDLVEEVVNNSKMVRQSSCRVIRKFEEGVCLAGGDITQIRMVLEATLANAVEAMEDGGEIVVTVRHLRLDGGDGPEMSLAPGAYALIIFEDHGVGMDEETSLRIFEPFFSTKFVGRGLGMAAAYGIVRNHDGMIKVESEPHHGTRVMIYLPGIAPPVEKRMDDPSTAAA